MRNESAILTRRPVTGTLNALLSHTRVIFAVNTVATMRRTSRFDDRLSGERGLSVTCMLRGSLEDRPRATEMTCMEIGEGTTLFKRGHTKIQGEAAEKQGVGIIPLR